MMNPWQKLHNKIEELADASEMRRVRYGNPKDLLKFKDAPIPEELENVETLGTSILLAYEDVVDAIRKTMPQMAITTLDADLFSIFRGHGLEVTSYEFQPIDDPDKDATGRWIIEAEHDAAREQ